MEEFQKKLSAYRTQRKKNEFIRRCREYVKKPVDFVSSLFASENTESNEIDANNELQLLVDSEPSVNFEADDDVPPEKFSWFHFVIGAIVWLGLFSYSIHIEFGAVFLILSGFYFIWTNTRTHPKRPDELSAYSVFNPNCERIQGTIDAEQLESEIRFGMTF